MENKLIAFFSKLTTLSGEEAEALSDSMVVKRYESGSFILKEGQRNVNSFFILEGLVRQYRLIDGAEVTNHFFREGQWIISLTSFGKNTVAEDYLICVEDTSVVVGNEQKAQELFARFPRFETLSRAVMETVFADEQQRIGHYLADTPEQRYLRLLQEHPDLLRRVQQYHLASYLGVKPESLSRIRKRIALKP